MKITLRISYFALLFVGIANVAHAIDTAKKNICDNFKKEKEHVAYLIGEDGKISSGPINYGKWIDDGKSDSKLISTNYKLLVFPERTEIVNNDCFQYGCLRLVKVPSMCKDVASYSVMVRLIFRRTEHKFYDFVDDDEFLPLVISDPKDIQETSLVYKFSPRIKGQVVSPVVNK